MNLSVSVSGKTPNDINVSMRIQNTGSNDDDPLMRVLHRKICNMLEPAVYEALRLCVSQGLANVVVLQWDGQTFRLKAAKE